jgi:hypothetical protein
MIRIGADKALRCEQAMTKFVLMILIAHPGINVMPGLDPGIHLLRKNFSKRWIAGSSPVKPGTGARQ